MEKYARNDVLRREARDTPRMSSREDNTDRRLDDTSRFATNRNQERRVEREYVNRKENRFGDRRFDTKDSRELTRNDRLESRDDFQREHIVKRNDVRRLQNERRDDLANVRRSDETRMSALYRKEDHTINPKYFDGSSFLSNPPDCFLKMRSVMKMGHTMLDNMDTTLFTQILLGGVTMALMWNKKQIHGGF